MASLGLDHWSDIVVVIIYFIGVLGVGLWVRKRFSFSFFFDFEFLVHLILFSFLFLFCFYILDLFVHILDCFPRKQGKRQQLLFGGKKYDVVSGRVNMYNIYFHLLINQI